MKKIFRFLFYNKLIRFFIRLIFNKYVLPLLAMCAIVYFGYQRLRPHIELIPAQYNSKEWRIHGQSFGKKQGASYLQTKLNNKINTERHYLNWDDSLIIFTPNSYTKGMEISVVKDFVLFTLSTEFVPMVKKQRNASFADKKQDIPVQKNAPWPVFRHNRKNTGQTDIKSLYSGDSPWYFQTGKGIFSTPVIDKSGNIYIGSADHYFYAINQWGSLLWKFKTGEIIDSGAAIPADETANSPTRLYVPSGDGFLYCLSAAESLLPAERIIWKFDSKQQKRNSYNNWFEGNVAIGFDGTIYAGNTNFNYYAIDKAGKYQWHYPTGSNNWSQAAIADDGTIFWGSNDTYIRAVRPNGKEIWRFRTLGFIAASAAIGSDGTVYIASFDSYLYALNPLDGSLTWKFKTNDHIYASAALLQDEQGKTQSILFGSTDGHFYALDTQGNLLWKYDTDAPIRSSAVIGNDNQGKQQIAYFGNGNGLLYALNVADGTLRWAFDTNSEKYELQDRNDLNGSPALGKSGVYIAGEHGQMWYVPYDYPLHHPENERCLLAEDLQQEANTVQMRYITPGGNISKQQIPEIATAGIITLQLNVRKNNQTIDAWVCNSLLGCSNKKLSVTIEPKIKFRWEKSADAHYIHIIPEEFMIADTRYTITISGNYYTGGSHLGNLTVGGTKSGEFTSNIALHTSNNQDTEFPLFGINKALELTRIATPIPPMMPSLNQIGFDYMDWIISTVAFSPESTPTQGRFIAWVNGAKRNEEGILHPYSDSDFMFPLLGSYQNNAFMLQNKAMTIPITGIPIPFNQLELRGELSDNMRVKLGASLYADTRVLSIPTFGKYLVLAGLANEGYKKLLVAGTYITRPLKQGNLSTKKPEHIKIETPDYMPPTTTQDGKIFVDVEILHDSVFAADKHNISIFLADAENMQPIYMDYHQLLKIQTNNKNNIRKAILTIPSNTELPTNTHIFVLLDNHVALQEKLDNAKN